VVVALCMAYYTTGIHMNKYAEALKTALVERHEICILSDMTGPTALNVIDRNKVTLVAQQLELPSVPEENIVWPGIADMLVAIHPSMKFFAFYRIQDGNLRYAAHESLAQDKDEGVDYD
jgi:hypothetical protein